MNTSVIALAGGLLIAAIVGGGLWWGYASDNRDTSSAPQNAAGGSTNGGALATGGKVDPDTGRRVLYWHDPMVPGPKFDKPGKSPFMDMQLVPVYADEGADQGTVSISPRTLQNLGIRTAEVKQGTMTSELHTVGAVTIDERNLNTVQSRVNGYIERLHVRAQYDLVKRGQPLVEIYAPEWLAAQQEYLTLKRATLPGADALLQASRQRLLLLGISEQQIQRIERDGQANPRVTLYAPIAGVVWELGARDGQAVTPGMTLFKLAGLETVWANAEVPEVQAALVIPGASVEARAAAWPNQVFKGQVAAILPEVNATTRTLRARVVLANPGGQLKPGMFARIELGGSGEPALMVPTEAVIRTGTRGVVVVAEADGKFRPVEVEVGRESGDMTEIRKGLEAGQQVVASGQFLIDSEASLRSALSRMNDPGAPASATPPDTRADAPPDQRKQR